MLGKLKQRWQIGGINLFFILLTFALGGSLCGYAGRKLLVLTGLEKGPLWILLYILLMTLIWPFCILLFSIPLGQFSFFIKYLTKIWKRMSGKPGNPLPIAIFASGAGSNAEKIIIHSATNNPRRSGYRVDLIVCNKQGAGVLQIAAKYKIETLLIDRERFFNGDSYIPVLNSHGIRFIVLAGFLWKVPVTLIRAYPNQVINIHPALLPKYGGKGMYGAKVHQAVIAAMETESGITIHYVDDLYDHGEIIFQATCRVAENDTPETLAQKIHLLEHMHYPEVVNELAKMQNSR
ncbi:MAG: phosphoribosylglycinamide formyltransferase [Ferruginibacter sp.]